jgi:hypothetical protein
MLLLLKELQSLIQLKQELQVQMEAAVLSLTVLALLLRLQKLPLRQVMILH